MQDGIEWPPKVYDVTELDQIKQPDWLIDGVLTESGLTLLVGDAWTSKSLIALAWGLSIATGRPWLDHNVPGRHYDEDYHEIVPAKNRNVLYVTNEGKTGFKPRVRAWMQLNNKWGKERMFNDMDVYANCVGPHHNDDTAINFVFEYMELADRTGNHPLKATHKEDFLREIKEGPWDVIIIDPLVNFFFPADENNNADAGDFMKSLKEITEPDGDRPGKHIILVHHTTKAAGSKVTPRGASAFRGAADFVYTTEAVDDQGSITLRRDKAKEGDRRYWELQARPVTYDWDREGNALTSAVVVQRLKQEEDEQTPARDLWAALLGLEWLTLKEIQARSSLAERTLRNYLPQLVQQGLVEERQHPLGGNRKQYRAVEPEASDPEELE